MEPGLTFRLRNVGAISDATIRVDGLTVIAGINGTGKSTVLKTIFAALESSRDLPNKRAVASTELATSMLVRLDPGYLKNGGHSASELPTYIARLDELKDRMSVSEREYFESMKRVYLDDSYVAFHEMMLRQSIEDEFGSLDQFVKGCRVDGTSDTAVSIDHRDSTRELRILAGGGLEWTGDFLDLPAPAYYDTPFILDCRDGTDTRDHRFHLRMMLDGPKSANVFVSTASEEKRRRLTEMESEIVPGTFSMSKGELIYTDEKGLELKMPNLASGMKVFAILKILTGNGYLDGDTVLLLDEPEVHLHPMWINVLAKVICALVKDMGVRVVTTTHSSQLLMALEGLSRDMDIPANYYMMSRTDGTVSVKDVSSDPQPLYFDMAAAINEASDMFWRDEDDD